MFTLLAASTMDDYRAPPIRRNPKTYGPQLTSIREEDEKKLMEPCFCQRWFSFPSPAQWVLFCLVVGSIVVMVSMHDQGVGPGAHGMRQLMVVDTRPGGGEDPFVFAGQDDRVLDEPAQSPGSSEFSSLLEDRAENNLIVLTVASSSLKDLTLNLLCSFEKIELRNYVIGALDEPIYTWLLRYGYPVFPAYESDAASRDELESIPMHRDESKGSNFVKEKMVAWALEEGYEVVMSDADVVWNRNPMDDFAEHYRNFDFAFQNAIGSGMVSNHLSEGLFYVKPTDAGKLAMGLLVDRLSQDSSRRGANEFQVLLCSNSRRKSSSTCYDHVTEAKTTLLPKLKYAKTWVLNRYEDAPAALERINPFTVHYRGGSFQLKKSVMAKHGLWHLDSGNRCRI